MAISARSTRDQIWAPDTRSPDFAADSTVYITYSEPGTLGGISGSSLALAKAKLVLNDTADEGFA